METRDQRRARIGTAIGQSKTKREFGKWIRKYIGERKRFCVLGPEFFGCMNTGRRARIVTTDGAVFFVGTELSPHDFYALDRTDAVNHFIDVAWTAQAYNIRSRRECERARKQEQSSDLTERIKGAIMLADHGQY